MHRLDSAPVGDTMRIVLRSSWIALLIVTLIEAPVWAGPSRPLGVIVEAQGSWLGTGSAESGATVFGGENLATESGGTLRVRAGATQFYLPADSSAALREVPGGVGIALQRGAVIFSSSGQEAFELRASEAILRARPGDSIYGRVSMASPRELEIASYRGTLEVTLGGETRLVAANSAYRVVLEPEPRGSGASRTTGRTGPWMWFAVTAVAVGTAIAIWRATISPDRP